MRPCQRKEVRGQSLYLSIPSIAMMWRTNPSTAALPVLRLWMMRFRPPVKAAAASSRKPPEIAIELIS